MDAKPVAKPLTKADDNTSPFKPGDCLCGIANCAGHEEIDGKILFKGHPELGDLTVEAPKLSK
jgi:hypothetical protein